MSALDAIEVARQVEHFHDQHDDRTVALARAVIAQDAEIATLKEAVGAFPLWKQRGADRLADEVAVLVERRIIDSRSPAGDALLDYRHDGLGPGCVRTERADRLVEQDREIARLREALATAKDDMLDMLGYVTLEANDFSTVQERDEWFAGDLAKIDAALTPSAPIDETRAEGADRG